MKHGLRYGALTTLLVGASALGGSRIGGGTLSSDTDLFSMKLPALFNGAHDQVKDDWIRLKGPITSSGTRFERNLIEILSLRSRYPAEVLAMERKAFVKYFEARGFAKVPHADECVALMKLVKSSGVFVIGGWGGGRGVIVTGPNSETVRRGIEELTASLKLAPKGCGWK